GRAAPGFRDCRRHQLSPHSRSPPGRSRRSAPAERGCSEKLVSWSVSPFASGRKAESSSAPEVVVTRLRLRKTAPLHLGRGWHWAQQAAPLLERDENQNQPLAGLEGGHRLADDRAVGPVEVAHLHGMAGGIGGGEHIACFNRSVRVRIAPAPDPPDAG